VLNFGAYLPTGSTVSQRFLNTVEQAGSAIATGTATVNVGSVNGYYIGSNNLATSVNVSITIFIWARDWSKLTVTYL